jgi:capsular exopolysaccharide synthesis family protein
MENSMRSQGALGVVRRRWRWLAGGTLLGLLAAVAWTLAATPTYRATGSVFFSLEYGDSAADLVQGSTYTQGQVASFAQLVDTPAVLQPVIDELGLDVRPAELAGRVEAAAPVGTVIIEVSATDPSSELSALIADAVIDRLSEVVENLAPANAQGSPTVRATTVADAGVPVSAASPDVPLALAVGLVAGVLLGLAAAFAREVQDNRVRDAEVVAQLTGLPLIGTIPARAHRSDPPVVVEADPHSPHAEAFRVLRTNLQFVDVLPAGDGTGRGVQLVAVTSSLSTEGKSTTAANLAVALAETGARVLLVDADLRRPSVADLLGVEGAVGLTTVLLGQVRPEDVVQVWGSAGLHVLPSGPVPPNPSELLGSPAMRHLLDGLRAAYDYVVLDTTPLLPVADAAILSRAVDGSIVVANATRVRRHQFAEALRTLEGVDARVLGVVLNQVRRAGDAYRYEQGERQSLAGDDLAVALLPAAAPPPPAATGTRGPGPVPQLPTAAPRIGASAPAGGRPEHGRRPTAPAGPGVRNAGTDAPAQPVEGESGEPAEPDPVGALPGSARPATSAGSPSPATMPRPSVSAAVPAGSRKPKRRR